MNDTERIAEFINQQLPNIEPGTLRFWGEWFGRPYDNLHRLISCDVQTDILNMRFDQDETLSVWNPHDLHIGAIRPRSRPILQIKKATRVRWEWFSYGKPHLPGNRYFEEFTKTSDGVEAATNIDWYAPNLNPISTEAAVEIL